MALQDELGFPNPVENPSHEAMLSLVVTGTLLAKEGDALLRHFGLTDSQFNVLMLLRYQAPPEGASQVQLGRMLVVNRSNVTGLVDRMEKAGWVKREGTPGDRRANRVRLTAPGRALLVRAEKAYMARVEEVMGSLTPTDRRNLASLLERVRAGLR